MKCSAATGSLAWLLVACARVHAPEGSAPPPSCGGADCAAFEQPSSASSTRPFDSAAASGSGGGGAPRRDAAGGLDASVAHDPSVRNQRAIRDADALADAAGIRAPDASPPLPVDAATADQLAGQLVVSASIHDEDAGTDAVPCNHGYHAQILSPTDGASGLPTSLTLLYHFDDPNIAVTYANVWASNLLGVKAIDARVANDLSWLNLRLVANTTYRVELGWICSPDSVRTRIPLAEVAFRTGL